MKTVRWEQPQQTPAAGSSFAEAKATARSETEADAQIELMLLLLLVLHNWCVQPDLKGLV